MERFKTAHEIGLDGRVLVRFVDRPASMAEALLMRCRDNPAGEALVDADRRWSWSQLADQARGFAAWLARSGVSAGDRVAVLLPNCAEFAICSWACWCLGCAITPIDVRETAAGIAERLNLVQPCAVVTNESLRHKVPAGDAYGSIVVVGADGGLPVASGFCPPTLDESAVAALLFTSGTSGKIKAATLTHGNVVHSSMHFQEAFGLTALDRCVLVTPMSHVTGLVAHLAAMGMCGGMLIVLREFSVNAFLVAMRQENATYTALVPAMYALLLLRADIRADEFPSWRIGAYGGAPMPQHVIEGLRQRLPALSLVNGYGATETCAPAVLMRPGDVERHSAAAGRPAACAELIVMDEDGKERPADAPGELWIKGPMVASGYWRDPESTAAAFVDGWWRSGDLGRRDADGMIHIIDRIGNVINRGGYKVPAVLVEHALDACPGVIETAVVPRACPVLGQRIHAFVRISDCGLDEAQLRIHCLDRLADYMHPDGYTLTCDPLPRNANGKLQKSQLGTAEA